MSSDLVAWKSHIGLTKSGDGVLRATAKGWGRSGAITEAVITRSSAEEGFLIALPQPNVSLFIGVSNLSGSLYDSGRAHQEDLEFSLRVSSDGTLSYSSRARLMQYYYAAHLEADVIGTYEKGDVVGMRLDPQRKGFAIVKQEARSEGGTQLRVLRNFSEVLQFPLKLMVVLGGSPMQVGPVTWLKASGDARAAAAPERSLKGPAVLPDGAAPAAAGGGGGEKVVKGRHAGDLLTGVFASETGSMLVLEAAEEGSWAAGCVRKVPPSAVAKAKAAVAAASSGAGSSSSGGSGAKPKPAAPLLPPPAVARAQQQAKARAASQISALQPRAVARGERLVPRSAAAKAAAAAAGASSSGAGSKRPAAGGERRGAAGVYEPRDRRPRDAQFRSRRRHCGGVEGGASAAAPPAVVEVVEVANPEDDESRQLDLLVAARQRARGGAATSRWYLRCGLRSRSCCRRRCSAPSTARRCNRSVRPTPRCRSTSCAHSWRLSSTSCPPTF